MRIVVSDGRSLIDLWKVSLLDSFLHLPYEFMIPNTLFGEESLWFTAVQKETLGCGGLKIMDLPGEGVLRAQAVVRKIPQISVQDGFAFALAESKPACILLTRDDRLRALVAKHELDVRGVL
jgi:hypothetical protein